MKYCIDCVHHMLNKEYERQEFKLPWMYLCKSQEVRTAEIVAGCIIPCSSARHHTGPCGPDGKYFTEPT